MTGPNGAEKVRVTGRLASSNAEIVPEYSRLFGAPPQQDVTCKRL